MRTPFVIFVILGFVGIAVFGFAAMGNDSEHSGCIASMASGVDCPGMGALDMFLFHANFFRGFSTATPAEGTMAVLSIFVVLAFIAVRRALYLKSAVFQLGFSPQRTKFLEIFSPPSKRDISFWLSLHEKSPSLI